MLLPLVQQVSEWNWGRYPFRAGDRILLSGRFNTGLYLALSRSYGNASVPITISSMDDTARATIAPAADNAITLYDAATDPARGLGIRITNLNLIGNALPDIDGEHHMPIMLVVTSRVLGCT